METRITTVKVGDNIGTNFLLTLDIFYMKMMSPIQRPRFPSVFMQVISFRNSQSFSSHCVMCHLDLTNLNNEGTRLSVLPPPPTTTVITVSRLRRICYVFLLATSRGQLPLSLIREKVPTAVLIYSFLSVTTS